MDFLYFLSLLVCSFCVAYFSLLFVNELGSIHQPQQTEEAETKIQENITIEKPKEKNIRNRTQYESSLSCRINPLI